MAPGGSTKLTAMVASATLRWMNSSCPCNRSMSARTRESSRSTVSTSLTDTARSSSFSRLSSALRSLLRRASRSMASPVTSR